MMGVTAGVSGAFATMGVSHLFNPHLEGRDMLNRGILGGAIFGLLAYWMAKKQNQGTRDFRIRRYYGR
jgi:hypothetical protein